LLSLVPLPIWTWYILRFSKVVQPAAAAVMEAEDKNVSIITENIAGVHVVKAFATEKTGDRQIRRQLRYVQNARAPSASACLPTSIRSFDRSRWHRICRCSCWAAADGQRADSAGRSDDSRVAMNAILSRLQGVATINEQYQNANRLGQATVRSHDG